jgi:acetoin:2,6-dichlorophenolindophenol oxidoreductase subunit alpha
MSSANQISECKKDAGSTLHDRLWSLYRQMFQIRSVEESLLELYSRGLLFGTVHTCIGQEVCAVGVTQALDPDRDVIWSSHRGHGHYLAFTGNLRGLISEVLGKAGGTCGGVGGSQHLHSTNFYSNGVLGGTVPCAVGCAFAEKFKATGGVVVVFLGDGAMAEGVVYESFNIASLWNLPILFVLEDNGYAQSTPKVLEHAGDIASRAESFRIPTIKRRAVDILEVSRAAQSIVDRIRRDSHPRLLALETFRLAPHSKGDDTRPLEELAALKKADPLHLLRQELCVLDGDRLDQLEADVAQEINQCVTTATKEETMDVAQFLAYADPR